MRGGNKCVWGSLMVKAERTEFWIERKKKIEIKVGMEDYMPIE